MTKYTAIIVYCTIVVYILYMYIYADRGFTKQSKQDREGITYVTYANKSKIHLQK